ncbi:MULTISPECIES: hypothetical protein [unclassified Klebsiella]|uniref:hypothetical protein n=1 Tax=unclassified Klebsiella TaxID=2608929 RepID=UPI0015DC301D|nr:MULTISPECIES: hypothetical protein [unclassified Klebsiella]BBR59359.1 hypothetical protein WP4W18E05_27270 [Klebsiella sp. WP4-W18-ESBL-05]BBT71187.1 hypothetical protein WP8S18E06_24860 [Klebsiella sp. WP8-S18-ESBL-06]
MSHDAEIIANAIAALKPAPDYLKDYWLPIFTMFCSALLGGLVAIRINRGQELQRTAKDNFATANQTFILAHECLNNLIAIKSNYAGNITWGEPLYRAIAYPTVLAKLEEVAFTATGFYFIRAEPTANKSLFEKTSRWVKYRLLRMKPKAPNPDAIAMTWRNTVRISSMFGNYNQVMMYLRARNEIGEWVKEPLSRMDFGNKQSFLELPEIIGAPMTAKYVSITELTIALTDHVIKELYSFLMNFPDIAESNIELSRIRDWGTLPRYKNDKPLFLKCLEPTPAPDFAKLAKYTGLSVEEAQKRHSFSDWG